MFCFQLWVSWLFFCVGDFIDDFLLVDGSFLTVQEVSAFQNGAFVWGSPKGGPKLDPFDPPPLIFETKFKAQGGLEPPAEHPPKEQNLPKASKHLAKRSKQILKPNQTTPLQYHPPQNALKPPTKTPSKHTPPKHPKENKENISHNQNFPQKTQKTPPKLPQTS